MDKPAACRAPIYLQSREARLLREVAGAVLTVPALLRCRLQADHTGTHLALGQRAATADDASGWWLRWDTRQRELVQLDDCAGCVHDDSDDLFALPVGHPGGHARQLADYVAQMLEVMLRTVGDVGADPVPTATADLLTAHEAVLMKALDSLGVDVSTDIGHFRSRPDWTDPEVRCIALASILHRVSGTVFRAVLYGDDATKVFARAFQYADVAGIAGNPVAVEAASEPTALARWETLRLLERYDSLRADNSGGDPEGEPYLAAAAFLIEAANTALQLHERHRRGTLHPGETWFLSLFRTIDKARATAGDAEALLTATYGYEPFVACREQVTLSQHEHQHVTHLWAEQSHADPVDWDHGCVLADGHTGPHYSFDLGPGRLDMTPLRLRWRGGRRELAHVQECPAEFLPEHVEGQPCVLPTGHEGVHSFERPVLASVQHTEE